MDKWFTLLLMIFLHIVDDYYLQGWLASAKQKEWWQKNAPQSMYKHDYIWALLMHSFSWTFMIMLPIAYAQGFDIDVMFAYSFFINIAIHAVTDHMKANLKIINLIQDQLVHISQIMITLSIIA